MHYLQDGKYAMLSLASHDLQDCEYACRGCRYFSQALVATLLVITLGIRPLPCMACKTANTLAEATGTSRKR